MQYVSIRQISFKNLNIEKTKSMNWAIHWFSSWINRLWATVVFVYLKWNMLNSHKQLLCITHTHNTPYTICIQCIQTVAFQSTWNHNNLMSHSHMNNERVSRKTCICIRCVHIHTRARSHTHPAYVFSSAPLNMRMHVI